MKCAITEEVEVETTEAEVVQRAQQGEPAAFESLYNRHSKKVYSVCLRMLKNTHDAEDLTQQVFLIVFRKIGTFAGTASFSTWLHRVAVNAALMHLRRKKQAAAHFDDTNLVSASSDAVPKAQGEDNSMLGAVEQLHLMRAIRRLPAGYKRLFLLHDVLGYRHTEIADLVGCSVGCSKSQVHKARRRLVRLLDGEQNHAGYEPVLT